MKTCIYCKRFEPEILFSPGKGEHVIPQFLGEFELYFGDDIVCPECNNYFSKLESIFKEDSLEGVYSAIWGLRETLTIRILKDRLNWTIVTDGGQLGVFENIFPFAHPAKQNIDPKPIIIIHPKERISNVIDILFVEKFADLARKQNAIFRKKKDWIKSLKKNGKLDITIFGNRDWNLEKIKELLQKYDIEYTESYKTEYFEDETRGTRWSFEFNAKRDDKILRLIAKIAFNYFSYCARESHVAEILYSQNFDKLRGYIRDGTNIKNEQIVQIGDISILDNENDLKKKTIQHVLTFKQENETIISELNLFGLFTYRVAIGKYPFRLMTDNLRFGCATVFDPFSKRVINTIYSTPVPIIGKPKYGLFCK